MNDEARSHLRETTFFSGDAWLLPPLDAAGYDWVTSQKPYWSIGPAFATLCFKSGSVRSLITTSLE